MSDETESKEQLETMVHEDASKPRTYTLAVIVTCPCGQVGAIPHPNALRDAMDGNPIGFACTKCKARTLFHHSQNLPGTSKIYDARGKIVAPSLYRNT